MELHASCAARRGEGVLLLGPSGAGKSDLLLRLLDYGFKLVADDRVAIEAGVARPLPGTEGLLEVRGLGIVVLSYTASVHLRLAVRLAGVGMVRLPELARLDQLDLPLIDLDPSVPSAPQRVGLALDCLSGRTRQVAGFMTT